MVICTLWNCVVVVVALRFPVQNGVVHVGAVFISDGIYNCLIRFFQYFETPEAARRSRAKMRSE